MFRFNKLITLTSKSKSPFYLSFNNLDINLNFNYNLNTNNYNNIKKIQTFSNKNFFKKTNYLQAAKKDYYSI
jgi:hypothetical protein